ncbi:uncharacterized protein LOC120331764 [Styela clava]
MIALTLLILMSSSYVILSAPFENCQLPHNRELDIDKLSNSSWYVGLQTKDIASNILTCDRLNNFTSTDSGFSFVVKEHNYRDVEFVVHMNWNKNRNYHMSRKEDGAELYAAHAREMNGNYNAAIRAMDDYFFIADWLFLTDYTNYFAVFLCPTMKFCDTDLHIVWGYFPSPTPTLKQIAAFYNALHDQGISAKFHVSDCSEMNWSD